MEIRFPACYRRTVSAVRVWGHRATSYGGHPYYAAYNVVQNTGTGTGKPCRHVSGSWRELSSVRSLSLHRSDVLSAGGAEAGAGQGTKEFGLIRPGPEAQQLSMLLAEVVTGIVERSMTQQGETRFWAEWKNGARDHVLEALSVFADKHEAAVPPIIEISSRQSKIRQRASNSSSPVLPETCIGICKTEMEKGFLLP